MWFDKAILVVAGYRCVEVLAWVGGCGGVLGLGGGRPVKCGVGGGG